MINLGPRPSVPRILTSINVTKFKKQIVDRVASGEKIKSKDFEDKPYWRRGKVKLRLWEHHKHKCCFCERKRDLKRESDVEHFRPKASVNAESHPGYWWLAYEWDNLLFSCKSCNEEYKKTYFPLLPGGIRALKEGDDLEKEKPVIINPVEENPEDYIGYEWQHSNGKFVKVVGIDSDGRGEKNRKLLGLNRSDLMLSRAELILTLDAIATAMKAGLHFGNHERDLINRNKKKIETETKSSTSYTGFRRAFFRSYGLGHYISTD